MKFGGVSANGIFPLCLTLLSLWLCPMARAIDTAFADGVWRPNKELTSVPIRIDGLLDEEVWQRQSNWHTLHIIEPGTLATPVHATELRMFYTDKGLYVSTFSQQPEETLVARLTGRDTFRNQDEVSVTMDTSGKGLYGYWFSVKLGSTLGDGTLRPERQYSKQWDGPWRGASAIVENGWTAEFFLPWSMMVLPPGDDAGIRKIGFFLSRKIAYLNENWAWPPLPSTGAQFITALQQVEIAQVKVKRQMDLYPYLSAAHDPGEGVDVRFGLDFFWRPLPQMQVVAAINPDFGAVESDDIVVNLSATESFFPEKRAFFLENIEVFAASDRVDRHDNTVSLVNTRRIGAQPRDSDLPDDLDLDDDVGQDPVDLYGAVRLTGRAGRLRYGLLAAAEKDQEVRVEANDQRQIFMRPGRDYGILRVLWEDQNERGNYGLGWLGTGMMGPGSDDAYTQGLDLHYFSAKGRFKFDAQVLHSHVDSEHGLGVLADLVYVPRQGRRHSLSLDFFDTDLDLDDLGFLRRNDQAAAIYSYAATDTNLPGLRSRETFFRAVQIVNTDGRLIRSGFFANRRWQRNSLDVFFAETGFFPARWEDLESDGNGVYRVGHRGFFFVAWRSDTSKPLSCWVEYSLQGEDLGAWGHRFGTGFRYQPGASFSLSLELGYRRRNGWLLHEEDRDFTTFQADQWRPSINAELFLSARQRLSMNLRWVGIKATEQRYYQTPRKPDDLIRVPVPEDAESRDFVVNNLVWQVRYRWEIGPLSDLFIVYNRSADGPDTVGESFAGLFGDAVDDPLVDRLIVKLRYRFGV